MNAPGLSSDQTAFTGLQKVVIAILALTQFTVILDFMVMSPLGDMLMKSLLINPQQFGFAVSAYAFSAGISGFLAAGFADRYDRKNLLLFFYAGFILGTLFCALAPNYPLLLAARIITGLFGGVIGSVGMAIVTDLFVIQQRGRVMGFVQTGFAASQVLGIPIGLYLANIWGWHAPFFLVVIMGILIFLAVWRVFPPVNAHLNVAHEHNAVDHLLSTIRNKKYQTAYLATAMLSIGGFLLMPFGSAFLVNNVAITQEQLPVIFMVTGLFSLVIMPVVGGLADKIDKFKLFAFGSVWTIIWMIIYTNLTPVPIWIVLIVNVLLFIGIMSRMVPATAIMSGVPEMKDRGAFMSVNSSLQQVAGGLAAVLAGAIIVQKTPTSPLEHYPILGIIGSGVILLCLWLVYRVRSY